MRERRRKFTPEFKDEAVKMVIESSRPVAEVAREIQVNEGTLGNWVHKYRLDHVGEEPPLSISDRARLRELERENRELKMKAEFLGKACRLSSPRSIGEREVRVHRCREGAVLDRENVRVDDCVTSDFCEWLRGRVTAAV